MRIFIKTSLTFLSGKIIFSFKNINIYLIIWTGWMAIKLHTCNTQYTLVMCRYLKWILWKNGESWIMKSNIEWKSLKWKWNIIWVWQMVNQWQYQWKSLYSKYYIWKFLARIQEHSWKCVSWSSDWKYKKKKTVKDESLWIRTA